MVIETSEEYQQLVERTGVALAKFRERAESLQDQLGTVSAATKVQVKAMVARLEKKYERGTARLSSLEDAGLDHAEELERLHQETVNSLSDMTRTIDRRILS